MSRNDYLMSQLTELILFFFLFIFCIFCIFLVGICICWTLGINPFFYVLFLFLIFSLPLKSLNDRINDYFRHVLDQILTLLNHLKAHMFQLLEKWSVCAGERNCLGSCSVNQMCCTRWTGNSRRCVQTMPFLRGSEQLVFDSSKVWVSCTICSYVLFKKTLHILPGCYVNSTVQFDFVFFI